MNHKKDDFASVLLAVTKARNRLKTKSIASINYHSLPALFIFVIIFVKEL